MSNKTAQIRPMFDSLGRELLLGQLVMLTINSSFKIGVIDEIYVLNDDFDRNIQKIKLRCCDMREVKYIRKSTSFVIYGRKLTILENLSFLPQEYQDKVRFELGIV
jgi:hypothetical protein